MPNLDYDNPVTLTLNTPVTETLYAIGTVQININAGTGTINGAPLVYGGLNALFFINCLKLTAGDVLGGSMSLNSLRGYRVKS